MTRRAEDPFAKLATTPDLRSNELGSIRVLGVQKPRGLAVCTGCAELWEGPQAVYDAAVHLHANRWDPRVHHRVVVEWVGRFSMVARMEDDPADDQERGR